MTRTLFLASKYLGGLKAVLPAHPAELRTVFIPTAGTAYADAPWIDQEREWLSRNGFIFQDLELARADVSQVAHVIDSAELVIVPGGNTYFLLHHMQRTRFWDALKPTESVYAGVSAGAIVTCPDVAYIDDLDERELAPDLATTQGGWLVDFFVLPHIDDVRVHDKISRIIDGWTAGDRLVTLADDQAVIVSDGGDRTVRSPKVTHMID
ncbi:Type 1 glutamine amidotransferase-like domain-containing protein [Nonomuraea sp. NPDC049158]|uniref:Type 1 glutamine amidotransferase-like domain-containing protein n=1 Tax=Nonomuraea sp. NPDC049158 TaxID=3155649 RepID=UPI003401FAFB